MPNPRLKELLSRAGSRMASELKDQLIPHAGEQGGAREEILRKFLRLYLPKRFDVSSGFVFDIHGHISQQLDIIVADSMVAPRFETAGDVRFYPCEAVVAVGQVKTHATSRREMWNALENLRSASVLDRSANGVAISMQTGEPIDHRNNHLHRMFTFLLILDRALSGSEAQNLLFDIVLRSSPIEWPNVVYAFEKYLITYHCDHGICPNTMDARGIANIDEKDFATGFLRFYIMLSQAISVTHVATMSSQSYLSELMPPMVSETHYASTNLPDELPPYLDSIEKSGPWEFPEDASIHEEEDIK